MANRIISSLSFRKKETEQHETFDFGVESDKVKISGTTYSLTAIVNSFKTKIQSIIEEIAKISSSILKTNSDLEELGTNLKENLKTLNENLETLEEEVNALGVFHNKVPGETGLPGIFMIEES